MSSSAALPLGENLANENDEKKSADGMETRTTFARESLPDDFDVDACEEEGERHEVTAALVETVICEDMFAL
jgi:hypothetical protein